MSGAHIWAPLPLQQLPPLPQSVLELLQALLTKNPADRPQTPGAVEDRAEVLLRSLPSNSVTASEVARAQSADSSAASVEAQGESTLFGAPVLISYLEPAVGQVREDRFELLEALPEGASGRPFRARERRGRDSRLVTVKFLHPSIYAHQEAAESLKSQFAAVHKFSHDNLLSYFALELGSRPPFLVREWVNGLNFASILRLKGALNAAEITALLEPLPQLLDTLASSGLSLVTVTLYKLWTRLPVELETDGFESWVKNSVPEQWQSRLAFDPLTLRKPGS